VGYFGSYLSIFLLLEKEPEDEWSGELEELEAERSPKDLSMPVSQSRGVFNH
jgi:hypothetical protein